MNDATKTFVITVRFNAKEKRSLERAAKKLDKSKSYILRKALRLFIKRYVATQD